MDRGCPEAEAAGSGPEEEGVCDIILVITNKWQTKEVGGKEGAFLSC